MNKEVYLDYQINVDWKKCIRKFWKPTLHSNLHRYFNIDIDLIESNHLIDTKNDILIIPQCYSHDEIKLFFPLFDKGLRFIVDSMWEDHHMLFNILTPYEDNGLLLVGGENKKIKWKQKNIVSILMSYWYIEYFEFLKKEKPKLNLKKEDVKYDFLMPAFRKTLSKELFIDLLGYKINKGLYSIAWKNIFLPIANNDNTIIDRYRSYNNEWYDKTYYSVVLETKIDNMFLTEKTFKPIMYGHPFMIYGAPNILKVLRNAGFQTFQKFFDESYDNEIDPKLRALKIIDQIEKFKFNEDINQIIIHNFNRFYDREIVLDNIKKEIKLPIEKFINES